MPIRRNTRWKVIINFVNKKWYQLKGNNYLCYKKSITFQLVTFTSRIQKLKPELFPMTNFNLSLKSQVSSFSIWIGFLVMTSQPIWHLTRVQDMRFVGYQLFTLLIFFNIIMISKYSFAIVWNFKAIPILAYLAWPKKTRTRRMSLKFKQRQMSILNSQ